VVVRHGFAEVNGVRLHYAEAGIGPLVVLLHGFPDYWYTWRHQMPMLVAAGFHVVAPDMRGYNLSDKPAGVDAYRLEVLCQDVSALIRFLGAERAHVVGHDWGAAVAWSFAMWHPEQVDQLAILNVPHPERLVASLRTVRQLCKSWYMFFFQLPWLPEVSCRLGNYAAMRAVFLRDPVRPDAFSPADVDQQIEAIAQPGALLAMINYYRAAMRQSPTSQRRRWRRIERPVLVLWGDQDRYLGKEWAEPSQAWVQDVAVIHFPNSSHWLQHDQPDEVGRALVAFFTVASTPMRQEEGALVANWKAIE
jgi:pimeloyl-ACP methyl ester carboxylesterase